MTIVSFIECKSYQLKDHKDKKKRHLRLKRQENINRYNTYTIVYCTKQICSSEKGILDLSHKANNYCWWSSMVSLKYR